MILKRKRKNGEEVKYTIDVNHIYDRGNDYYSLRIPTEKENIFAGHLNFALSKTHNQNSIYIYDLKVADEYSSMGNGKALLQAMEYIAYKHYIDIVEGKFYPHDTHLTKEQTIDFYKDCGYTVDETNHEIYKYLKLSEIASTIAQNVSDFQVNHISNSNMEL